MNREDVSISFIVPLFNEEDVFDLLAERLDKFSSSLKISHEIILIDDGSTDTTPLRLEALALRDSRYHSIFLSRNFGHQFAISAGLQYSKGKEGVMILDGDLQDPPEIFNQFYEELKKGFDVIYGVRAKRKENRLKKLSYYFFYRLLKKISVTPISLDSGDFSLISRRVVDIINRMPEKNIFLRGLRSWVGFKQIGIHYDRESRAAGKPKYTMTKLFKLGYDGVFSFSSFPIKFLTWSGAFCIVSSLVYLAFTIYKKIFADDVPSGFTALLFIIIFFGGVQLISIGIIGEYVFRIFDQVKNRPTFIVKSRIQNQSRVDE